MTLRPHFSWYDRVNHHGCTPREGCHGVSMQNYNAKENQNNIVALKIMLVLGQ